MGSVVSVLRELVEALEARTPVVSATVVDTSRSVPRRPGSKMLVFGDGTISGSIGGGEMEARVIAEALGALADRRTRRLSYTLLEPATGDPGVCGGEVELYLEPHMPPTTLFVIGLGHVGRAVVELAAWTGFEVVAWDDRPELATDLPDARQLMSDSFAEAIAAFAPDAFTHAVMVTRNAALDAELLPLLLSTPVASVGLMGSRRRWDTTRAALEAAGVPAEDIARVRTPVGLEIAAETPREIAVSILAEVVGLEHGA